MEYSYKKQLNLSFAEAVESVKTALAQEGFGVLTEIDVKATLKNKLNLDYDDYLILGVCNPPLAHRALLTEKEVGLLLPCNVIIYESEEKVLVSTILPTAALSLTNNDVLYAIAEEAEKKLKNVINKI